jgi:hypothetical protein
MATVRHQGSITSLSWIPSEAVEGSTRLAFDAGLAHYDDPPGERTSTLVAVTPCRVAVIEASELDRGALQELSKDNRRTQPDRS